MFLQPKIVFLFAAFVLLNKHDTAAETVLSSNTEHILNPCPSLSLYGPSSPYIVDLLATAARIPVGSVTINFDTPEFTIDVNVATSCSLLYDLHVSIKQSFDPLSILYPLTFLCKKTHDSSSHSSITCPLGLFLTDCCDTSLTIIVHTVVSCSAVDGVYSHETAYAGKKNDGNNCGTLLSWCNYVPFSLNDGCTSGCNGDTRFDTTCTNNRCTQTNVTECTDMCTSEGSISEQTCVDGECAEVGVTPCSTTCNGDLLSLQTCTDGQCVEESTEVCEPKCNGNDISVQGCQGGSCVEKNTTSCPNICNGDDVSVQTCAGGTCVEMTTNSCQNTCASSGIVTVNTCTDGTCGSTGTQNCNNECASESTLDVKECFEGDCVTTASQTCSDTCADTNTISKQKCIGDSCTEFDTESCVNECTYSGGFNASLNRNCQGGVCVDDTTICDPCSPCQLSGTAQCGTPPSCPSGRALNTNTCTCECSNSCPSPKVLNSHTCACECPNSCTAPKVLNTETCDCECTNSCPGPKVPNPDTCACECPSTLECPSGMWFNDVCECVCNQTCSPGYYLSPSCTCVADPCDACPDGAICTIVDDGTTEKKICRGCACGYCNENNKDCCRINSSGVNCVPNQAELSESCKAEDFSAFPIGDRNDVCAGEEKVGTSLGDEFLAKCGCTPGQSAACVIEANELTQAEKCFVDRRP